jgi:cell division protein FtsQ
MAASSFKQANKKTPFSFVTLLKVTFVIVPILAILLLLPKKQHNEYFPITDVQIFGIQHISHEELQNLVLPFIQKGFFAVDLSEIKERIAQLSWTNAVVVQRVWPDKLIISLSEKNAIALWNGQSLLSDSGEIFTPSKETYPKNLPKLIGLTGEQLKLMRYYTKINALFSPLHFKVTNLALSPLQSWEVTLSNGMKLNAGNKDILTRLSHFVKVYPKIIGAREGDVEYIDLRYPNGMAVRWKSVI